MDRIERSVLLIEAARSTRWKHGTRKQMIALKKMEKIENMIIRDHYHDSPEALD